MSADRLGERERREILAQIGPQRSPRLHLPPLDRPPPGVPAEWLRALASTNPESAVLETLWAPAAALLPRTVAAMERALKLVCLLTADAEPPRLLYGFAHQGDLMLFCGEAPDPTALHGPPSAPPGTTLHREMLGLDGIHDGWTGFFVKESGPLPARDRYWLARHPDPELVARYRPIGDPARLLVVSSLPGPGCLGLDLTQSPPLAYLCWKDLPPELVPDIPARIDDDLGLLLEHMDPIVPGRAPGAPPRSRGRCERAERVLRRAWPLRERALELGDGGFFARAASEWLVLAVCQARDRGGPPGPRAALTHAIEHMGRALELGCEPPASELLDVFWAALAVDDRSFAHFVAASPGALSRAADLDLMQAQTAFALLREDRPAAAARAAQLAAALAGTGDDGPYEPTSRADPLLSKALCALAGADARAFVAALAACAGLGSGPAASSRREVLDLAGLGLCRLAQVRGIPVDLGSVGLAEGALALR